MVRHSQTCEQRLWLAAGLLLINAIAVGANSDEAPETTPGAAAPVQVTAAERRILKETIVAYGRLQPDPRRLIQISLPRAGQVGRLWVRVGQRVRRGDALLELKTTAPGAAEYAQARTAVQFAKRDLTRLEEMLKEHLATRDQVAKARQALADARVKLEAQRRLGVNQATQTLTSPFDGVVTQLAVDEGQRVQADTTALTLTNNDALIVVLGLEPEDAARAKPGTAVVLTPVFPPMVRIQSQISSVHAMINPQTRLVDAIVPLPEVLPSSLRLNEYLRGSLTLSSEETLAVPRRAVLQDDAGTYVFVVRNGKACRVDVGTGIESGGWIAVSGNLQAGEPVVSLGSYELSNGVPVRETGR